VAVAVRILFALLLIHYGWCMRKTFALVLRTIRKRAKALWNPSPLESKSESDLLLSNTVHRMMGEMRTRRLQTLAQGLRFSAISLVVIDLLSNGGLFQDSFDKLLRLVLFLCWTQIATSSSPKLTHFSYSVFYVFQMLVIIMVPRSSVHIQYVDFKTLLRVMSGMMYLDFWKSLVWNLLISVTVCIVHIRFPGPDCGDGGGENYSVLVASAVEFVLFALIMLGTYLVQRWTEQQVRTALSARANQGAKEAAHDVLSVLCDAVLYLDSDLAIKNPDAKLFHLLRQGNSDGGHKSELAGVPFVNHVVEQDKKRFTDFASTSRLVAGRCFDSGMLRGPAAVLHVSLVGSLNSVRPVELFHAYFPDLKGDAGHLVGIREVSETSAKSPPEVVGQDPVPAAVINGAVPIGIPRYQLKPQGLNSSARSSSQASTSSSLSSSSSVGRRTVEPFTISLDVDIFSSPMQLQSCTIHFLEPTTACQDLTELGQWVSGSGFVNWLQQGANSLLHDDVPEDCRQIKLRPPAAGTIFSGEKFAARRAELELIEEDGGEGGASGVSVNFLEVYRLSGRRHKSKRDVLGHSGQPLPSITETGSGENTMPIVMPL